MKRLVHVIHLERITRIKLTIHLNKSLRRRRSWLRWCFSGMSVDTRFRISSQSRGKSGSKSASKYSLGTDFTLLENPTPFVDVHLFARVGRWILSVTFYKRVYLRTSQYRVYGVLIVFIQWSLIDLLVVLHIVCTVRCYRIVLNASFVADELERFDRFVRLLNWSRVRTTI